MTFITEKSIIEAVQKIDKLDENSLERLSDTYVSAQTSFAGYLFSSTIEFENESLLELILYYFNVFSEAIANQGIKMNRLEEDYINEFQEEYVQTLDEYFETDDEDLIESLCDQPMMLSFFLNDIFGEDHEGKTLPEETATQLFIVGIALIALFNRAMID